MSEESGGINTPSDAPKWKSGLGLDSGNVPSHVSDNRKFILRSDNVFLERDTVSEEYKEPDLCLVKIDDLISLLDLKVKEICSKIIYDTDDSHTKETESHLYGAVYDKIESEGIFDLISFDVNISSIKIKSVIDFLIRVNSKYIDEIINYTEVESDPDLDFSSMLTVRIKEFNKKFKVKPAGAVSWTVPTAPSAGGYEMGGLINSIVGTLPGLFIKTSWKYLIPIITNTRVPLVRNTSPWSGIYQ